MFGFEFWDRRNCLGIALYKYGSQQAKRLLRLPDDVCEWFSRAWENILKEQSDWGKTLFFTKIIVNNLVIQWTDEANVLLMVDERLGRMGYREGWKINTRNSFARISICDSVQSIKKPPREEISEETLVNASFIHPPSNVSSLKPNLKASDVKSIRAGCLKLKS